MESNIVVIINHIKQINASLREQYQTPVLVDGTNMDNIQPNYSNTIANTKGSSSYDYQKLIRQQRKLLYKKDLAAKEKAENNMKILTDRQNDDEIKQKLSAKINFRSAIDELNDQSGDLCKPWNKLPNNLKIQAALKFIEAIKSHITNDQSNQLRYLLISSISQRKLSTLSDVSYNATLGQIESINKLSFEQGLFKLMDPIDDNKSIGLSSFKSIVNNDSDTTKVPISLKPKTKISLLVTQPINKNVNDNKTIIANQSMSTSDNKSSTFSSSVSTSIVPLKTCVCGVHDSEPYIDNGMMYHSRSDWKASEHGGWNMRHPAIRISTTKEINLPTPTPVANMNDNKETNIIIQPTLVNTNTKPKKLISLILKKKSN